jgi:orotidine-5'-phosphate decarboxylase
VSFFERFGSKGFAVLEEVTRYAAQADLIVIADAKRGDIGTTMDAYFEAWFGDDSGLFADALTVSPYLGLGAVTNGFALFEEQGKGLFSLVATSNPEGKSVQLAKIGSDSLAVDQLRQLGELNADSESLGNFGAVLGATLNFDAFDINLNASTTPVLAPGFGAQGAQLSDARRIFGDRADQVCYSVSRSVLSAGPSGVDQLIESAAKELAIALEK